MSPDIEIYLTLIQIELNGIRIKPLVIRMDPGSSSDANVIQIRSNTFTKKNKDCFSLFLKIFYNFSLSVPCDFSVPTTLNFANQVLHKKSCN